MKKLIMISVLVMSASVFAGEVSSTNCASLIDSTDRSAKIIDSTNSSSNTNATQIVTE